MALVPFVGNSQVTDIEGNTYKIVQIGTQLWMAENLRTTKFNDNSIIPLLDDEQAWSNSLTPAYCWYENDSNYKSICGAIYWKKRKH